MTTNTPISAPKSNKVDFAKLRSEFPILDQKVHGNPLIYFDNAATTQKPRVVIDALRRYYEKDNANVHRGIHELSNRATAAFESARDRAACFINARSAAEIVFTSGATEGINLVAQAWGSKHLKRGDKILLTEMEHHSNIVPWQLLAERVGVELLFLPINGDRGLLNLAQLDEYLTKDVKLLAMTHISNSLGTINPVADYCQRARKRGVVTLIDAAQSAGHRPLDVQQIGCDFLVFSSHKMCGPTGIGVLYGRRERLEHLEPTRGGSEMIKEVWIDRAQWNDLPWRFEPGTPAIAEAVGLTAAIEYLEKLGMERVTEHERALARRTLDGLVAIPGVRVFGPPSSAARGAVVAFAVDGLHPHDVAALLDAEGIAVRAGHHCAMPLMRRLGVVGTSRASFSVFNSPDEVERLLTAVAGLRAQL